MVLFFVNDEQGFVCFTIYNLHYFYKKRAAKIKKFEMVFEF